MRIRWRNLELPNRVVVNEETYTPEYGEFTIEPFERGFGHTIGNSLRRVLLSSLEGTAPTSLRLEGVAHEFTAIPGVLEDVTDIVLNLKGLLVKLYGDGPVTLKLQREKAGEVRAGDFACPPEAEIVNPDLLVCTLTENRPLKMEVEVRRGRGYATAEENEPEEREPGVIYLDSLFSPVRRVSYRVENTRVGQVTNYDRLILNIWTDGTVTPDLALVEAAKILRKHLNCLVHYPGVGTPTTVEMGGEEEAAPALDPELLEKLRLPISELNLSVRATNCLESENIRIVADLVSRTESDLLNVRNFGQTTLQEVQEKLRELGLELGMDVSPYRDKLTSQPVL